MPITEQSPTAVGLLVRAACTANTNRPTAVRMRCGPWTLCACIFLESAKSAMAAELLAEAEVGRAFCAELREQHSAHSRARHVLCDHEGRRLPEGASHIVPRGERNSGTVYLYELLKENTLDLVEREGGHGANGKRIS